MPRVVFTPNLHRHVDCQAVDVHGATVREALDQVFASQSKLRGYVVDEHGALRKHMVIFVNGAMLRDRERLSDPVDSDGEIYVFQALSGG
jgi:sulfur-carrier protein